MKSCAEVPARVLSNVITTAPSSPVPASSRSLLASSDRRNCGLFGLKKLRGCGSKVTANVGLPWARPIRKAASITARWPRWTPSNLSMPVLVVDDYSTMIRIIRNLLKQLGFDNIDDASDGSAALNKMRGKKYGLVISDWNMEPMTGYDLLKEVRADPNLATTPFIMITAESKTENVIAAKKAGVNNYIVKPFNAATLKTKIEAVFPDMASA